MSENMEQASPLPDMRRIVSGEIPWSPEEFHEVMEWEIELRSTPHDDWPYRKERRLNLLDEETGEVQRLRFNVDHPGVQVTEHFQTKYADEEPTMWGSHWFRYLEIKSFFAEHMADLIDEGLAFEDPDEEGAIHLSEAVVAVLCRARYTADRDVRGEPHPTFDCERVIAQAAKIQATEEESGE